MSNELLKFFLRIEVWEKASKVEGRDPRIWRMDDHFHIIRWDDYGNRDSEYGWEMDHYPTPKALGGADTASNMRALHWRGNASHGGLLSAFMDREQTPDPVFGGLFGLLPRK